jgi:hypothetical protein
METLTLQERLLKVQVELKAPKNQYNGFGKYKYRNQEDILEAVKPLLFKYSLNLIITDEVREIGGLVFIDASAKIFGSENEPVIEVSAQAGVDPDRKGMDIAQSFGSSSSYARKYALNGLFLIDDTKDADGTNTHGKETTVSAPVTKSRLAKSGEAFEKVKLYLSKGGSLDEVKKKYQITKEVEQLLIN